MDDVDVTVDESASSPQCPASVEAGVLDEVLSLGVLSAFKGAPVDQTEAVDPAACGGIGMMQPASLNIKCVTGDLPQESAPIESLQLYAFSWRSAKTGILMERINFPAKDEEDLLARINERVPRDLRVGAPGRSLGAGTRRIVDDADDSLQWVWQPTGISGRDTSRDLSQLCASVEKKN